MKRENNLFERIVSMDNLILADMNARKGKTKQYGVRHHDKHREEHLQELQMQLSTLTYKTSEYTTFTIHEPKEREIYRLPYYPDRITHHALMDVLEPIWEKVFINNSFACRKRKGIHAVNKILRKDLRRDPKGTKWCLKIDVRKFYPSIDHDILKTIIRKKIKCKKTLQLLDSIIDSAQGVPIGNYLSQYFANLYLTYFDHWLKEEKHIKYYYRYCDDMVILHSDKQFLHKLLGEIKEYLAVNLKLELKPNSQVFEVDKRLIDFVGYRFAHNYTLMRKSIKSNLFKLLYKIRKYKKSRSWVRDHLSAYSGWLKYCNSINFCKKHINSLCEEYDLPKPEHIVEDKIVLITSLCDKPIVIRHVSIYPKYFKIHAYTNKKLCAISHSKNLFYALQYVKKNRYYILKRFKNKYKVYDITSN